MSNNYIFCKIFVLLFFSFLSVSCGVNNVNSKTDSTTNNNIVITPPERVVNIKEGETFRFVFKLNRASTTDVSFDWSVQHISTSSSDFMSALFGTQLIRAGDTIAIISIDTRDDTIYETDETFILNITNITGVTPNSLVASGRIIDNDAQPNIALLGFEQDYSTALEGTSLTYRLQLNRASATDVIFDWHVQHSSTSAEDFTGIIAGTQLMRAGDTSTIISIDTSDDIAYEGDENFILNITNVTGAAPSSLAAGGRIRDNDAQPNIVLLSFEQDHSTALEGTSLTYRLELNRASATDVSFDWHVQHHLTSTSDFTGALGDTKRIRAGDTTITISIDTSDDNIYEGDENFILNITKVMGAVPNRLVASGNIIDNDTQLVLSFKQSYSIALEGTSYTYRLELNRASAADVIFDWYVQHHLTSTSDFTGIIAGSQLIRAGDTTATIIIDTSDDNISEGNEIFSLNLTKVMGAVPNSLAAGSSIIDNDTQLLLSFEQDYSNETEGTSHTYRLQLNRASATDVAFDWSVQHISTSTSDFTSILEGTKRIRAGDTTTTISIDTSDDTVYETDETFSLNIIKVTGAAPDALVAGGRIIDNDAQPIMSLLSFEQIDSTTTEGVSFTYKLELNRVSLADVSFDWSVQHISTSTSDFTSIIAGTQLIRAGDTSTTIIIDTSDDTVYETDEIFSLNIIKIIGATPDRLAAGGRIIDNDAQPIMSLLSFEQIDSTTTEGASLTYKLELNRANATDITFDWFIQHISTSTSDFTGIIAGTQLIRAGDTSTTIIIDTSDDTIYETDETFSLNIIKVTGATPDRLAAGGRIIDNDTQPIMSLLSFEQVDSTSTEGASFTYKLELNRASATDITFDWFIQHISTSTSDFTSILGGTQLIRAGDTTTTISIDTSDDTIYETDETFSLNIIKVTGATPDRLAAGGRIIDNDPQPNLVLLSFEQVDSTSTEGASFTYKLELNRVSLADVSFDWFIQHISTSTSDFTGIIAGTQLIRAGDTSTIIIIDTSDDTVYETDKTFSLNIIKVIGATPDALAAGGRIIDNDAQPIMSLLSFEQIDSTTTEGASFTYKLELNRVSLADVSFDWSVQHISTSTSDFTGIIAGTQLIRAGDTSTIIIIDTSDDTVYETDETFSLNIIKVIGATPDALAAGGRIIDNDTQPIMSLLSFEQVDSTTIEGASFTYKLELNRASLADVSFDWFIQHISTSTSDFTGIIAGTQLIRAGDTSTTIIIDTSDDTIYETDEIFSLNITNIRGATPDALAAGGRIIDNDAQPSVTLLRFEQDYLSATEDVSLNYRLELNRASLADVSFDWSVQHISTSTSDFTGIIAGTQLIRAGDTSTTIIIDTSDDTIYETDETFSLNIIKVIGATPDALAAGGRIIDNDPQSNLVLLSFEQVDSTSTEGASLTYKLELNRASATDITFDWFIQHISTSTSDFTGIIAGTQLIRAGDTSTIIIIDTSDDTVYETDETFTLNITNIRGATPDSLSASITILANDLDLTVDYNGNGLIDLVTREQFDNIRYNLAGTSYKTSTNDTGKTCGGSVCRGYELLANLDLSASANWQPIGSQHNPFTSILQGNGHSIANLVIDGVDYLGLFAALSGAMIDNLVVEVASITGDSYVGALAGRATTSIISRLQIRAANTNSKLSARGANIGGMLGEITGTTIINATSNLNVVKDHNNADNVGGIVGYVLSGSISYVTSNASVFVRGSFVSSVGGLAGAIRSAIISHSSASGSVSSSGSNNSDYGGLVGKMDGFGSTIRYSSASGSVTSNGTNSDNYGGLVGMLIGPISYSSASGSVISNGTNSDHYGGLVGYVFFSSTIRYSSASGSVISSGDSNDYYGGLAGDAQETSKISYTSASGNVINNSSNSNYYGGLVGDSDAEVQHSWSSSSVFANSAAGLVSRNIGSLKFSYALGAVLPSGFGLIAENTKPPKTKIGSVDNSYWNSETSGVLKAADVTDNTINIASSDTAGMLDSTGSAGARIFKDFAGATDELGDNIWSFVNGYYPVITELGVDKQAVSLAYGLLRFASPYASTSTLDSFLGATLNNEDIELIANSYNARDTLAILDVNLLQSNSATCAAGSTDSILTTTGANGTTITLQKIAGNIEIEKRAGNSCDIIFSNQKTDGTLQLAAIISKGAASLTKKFEITLNAIHSIIALQPTTLSTREGDELVFIVELNHRASRDLSFDWFVQHSSTSTSDFTGATSGHKTIFTKDTATSIELQINDDNLPENFEDFTLNITNIRGITSDSLSSLITILENDLTVDYNGNGLIDLVTQEHLDNIRYNLAGTSYKTSTTDTGKNCGGSACRGYELFSNLDLSEFTNWQPIGSKNNPFTSILQGNGYSIENLVIDRGNNIGLFTALSGATIDNLVVEVASIAGDSDVGALAGRAENSAISRLQVRAASASSTLSATGANIGGILGAITGTTITNATSDLRIVGGNNDNADNVGGIVGYVSSSDISYAYSSDSVSVIGSDPDNVGGLVGYMQNYSAISYSSTSSSVTSNGSDSWAYGGLVGRMRNNSTISYSSASGSVTSNGDNSDHYGGLVGRLTRSSTISYSSASGSVTSTGNNSDLYGGLVGELDISSTISDSSASGGVTSNGINSDLYGGLVGRLIRSSTISYSSASGSVTSTGGSSDLYGGLVGIVADISTISYSSAIGNIISDGRMNENYGGLVGWLSKDSTISYSSASGNIISRFSNSNYGGLVGGSNAEISKGEIIHSWSSSSVFANNPAGLVNMHSGDLGFSYALGAVFQNTSPVISGFGLVAMNTGTIKNSYWNIETSGALEAADAIDNTINIASSDTAGMLASTGVAGASVFADFADATDKHNRNIWTFANGSYPVITKLGVDKQAVSLAYGLLRLASPYVGVSNLDSFLGVTLNNENIELIANSYNARDTLAILDVNLLQSNSVTCTAGSGDIILTTTGANGTTIALQKIAGSIEIAKSPSNSCDIIFSNQKTDGTLQLAALISKGAASLTKKFEITLNTIQSIIALQPTTLSTREGDELVFIVELNHRASRDVSFDWFVQHSSTSTSDFTGAISGHKTIFTKDTATSIELQINDDNLPENFEDFTLNITNIRGVTSDSLSASITILENDLTVDYNGNGLIDIVTQEHFDNIRYNLAGTSYKTSASDAGKTCGGNACRGYELLGDLDLSEFTNWQPIGSQNNPFTSILQGNGYSIANLAIDGGNNIGLFAALSGATIDNLVVEVASISGDSYVGALAGRAEQSAISRLQVRAANTNSKLSATGANIGGILGAITGTTIINVTSDLSIVVGSNDNSADNVGGIVGYVSSSTISYATSSGSVFTSGGVDRVGGLVGQVRDNSKISYSSSSGHVSSTGDNGNNYGGLVGEVKNSQVSYGSASGSVTSNGQGNNNYGGLAGGVERNSEVSYGSASGSVTSNGQGNNKYGGLFGAVSTNSTVSYSSASGSVTSNGKRNNNYGGLAGRVERNSQVSYSSASGSVTSNGKRNNSYGGLFGFSAGEVLHSWSSSSVFASSAGGLMSLNSVNLGFSYALGFASYGLVNTNTGTITNSYWNSETSGALEAADAIDNTINIASSDTAGMLASTGVAGASVFAGFFDATDELGDNIWSFANGSYPVITKLGVDKQAVSLAYGLLRLASPYVGVSNLDSFLGATLNNENIELIANSYTANDTLAILDVNLLQSNSVTCAAGSGDIILTTTGANGTTIALQKIAGSLEIEKSPSNSCDIIFSNQKTDGTLQLAALISKGATILTKKFEITLQNIQSRIALQPRTLSTREGDKLVFTLELNHRARRDIIFDWFVQHSSTSTSDFTGAISGHKTIFTKDTATSIELQINDDNLPENFEYFTLNITNIRGITSDSLSSLITILENDLTVDYNKNGLIDIITQERLGNIRHNLAGTSYKTSASDAGVKCGGSDCRGYELLANLDLSSFANWQPIGSQNDPFTSILQGNGYSIANLAIDGEDYLGLFAALSGATIDNLVVEVASITGDSYVGALAGRAEQSTISRVQIRAVNANSKLQTRGFIAGGLLGFLIDSNIMNVTSDLSIVGGNNVGGIVGYVSSSNISYAYSSGSVSASGGVDYIGGLVGSVENNSIIRHSSASGSVTSNGNSSTYYGGLVGAIQNNSIISHSSASGSVTSNGNSSTYYGGLVGSVENNSIISHSSASGGVISNGDDNIYYGGLAGAIQNNSTISYSSASGNMNCNGDRGGNYGGLSGYIDINSKIRYSNAIGSVIGNGSISAFHGGYGGLVGFSEGEVRHSWSGSSVFANSVAGLVNRNPGDLGFSYALGVVFQDTSPTTSGFGLVATNTGTIANNYWNSETSGALEAASANVVGTNIASSDTDGMLASTGVAGASVFADFADATDELSDNIWTFTSGNYPVITALGLDKQAVALAYGLLRLASPHVSDSSLDSFLGNTVNNENIELIANSYNANDTLAILDVNLLQSNSATCVAGSTDSILTTTGANQAVVTLSITSETNNLHERIVYTGCNIGFDGAASISAGDRLQLVAIITKGSVSLSKKFVINFR